MAWRAMDYRLLMFKVAIRRVSVPGVGSGGINVFLWPLSLPRSTPFSFTRGFMALLQSHLFCSCYFRPTCILRDSRVGGSGQVVGARWFFIPTTGRGEVWLQVRVTNFSCLLLEEGANPCQWPENRLMVEQLLAGLCLSLGFHLPILRM